MKIDKPFNQLKKEEYRHFIENHKQYSNFNTLGLYRSLLENENLSTLDKIEIRDIANSNFAKTFEFLQLKDPYTYFNVSTLGQTLTRGDELNLWQIIRENQQKILKDKKIKHRNFGSYSKHNCGYETCPYNGLMIRQGSRLAEMSICFSTDLPKHQKRLKANFLKKETRDWRKKSDPES